MQVVDYWGQALLFFQALDDTSRQIMSQLRMYRGDFIQKSILQKQVRMIHGHIDDCVVDSGIANDYSHAKVLLEVLFVGRVSPGGLEIVFELTFKLVFTHQLSGPARLHSPEDRCCIGLPTALHLARHDGQLCVDIPAMSSKINLVEHLEVADEGEVAEHFAPPGVEVPLYSVARIIAHGEEQLESKKWAESS